MIVRRDPSAKLFLGCSKFPSCTHTEYLDRAQEQAIKALAKLPSDDSVLADALDIDLWFFALHDEAMFDRIVVRVSATLNRYVPIAETTLSSTMSYVDNLVSLPDEILE